MNETASNEAPRVGIVYPSPIFGPVHSRRLGVSLGVNLMPADGKLCTFDCLYCECGFNAAHRPSLPRPTREEVAQALEAQLKRMAADGPTPDVLTFAGNGEPTAHPDFPGIIDDTLRLRDAYFPSARVSVLSNATFAMRPAVRDALRRVDNNILKLDTVSPDYIRAVDRPAGKYRVEDVVEAMKAFQGHVIVQTLFMKGLHAGFNVDNTTDEYVLPWLEAVKSIGPELVMVYTIDRATPAAGLEKASHAELDRIAALVRAAGIAVETAY